MTSVTDLTRWWDQGRAPWEIRFPRSMASRIWFGSPVYRWLLLVISEAFGCESFNPQWECSTDVSGWEFHLTGAKTLQQQVRVLSAKVLGREI